MRYVYVEFRLDRRAALAPALVMLLATTAACSTSGSASTPAITTPTLASAPSGPSAA